MKSLRKMGTVPSSSPLIAFAKIGERGMLRGSCNPKGCLDKVEKNKIRKSKELYEHYEHALELADEK